MTIKGWRVLAFYGLFLSYPIFTGIRFRSGNGYLLPQNRERAVQVMSAKGFGKTFRLVASASAYYFNFIIF